MTTGFRNSDLFDQSIVWSSIKFGITAFNLMSNHFWEWWDRNIGDTNPQFCIVKNQYVILKSHGDEPTFVVYDTEIQDVIRVLKLYEHSFLSPDDTQ